MTKTNDQITSSGRVKQICQNFLLHSDSGLAHRLQEEEFAVHFDRNRTHRRDSRLGVRVARDVEAEEKQAFVAKQFDFYQQKQQIEENDIALARQLQEQLKLSSNTKDRAPTNTHYHSHDKHDYHHEKIDESLTQQDTSSDEQLARILQEEERLLLSSSSTNHRSHYKSTFV